MTLYILFDSLDKGIVSLEDTFSVSRNAYQKEGSTIYAELETEISVENLIKGIVVSSGNDACVIVAEALSGSEESFAQQMNYYALEMGLNDSNFKNSSGSIVCIISSKDCESLIVLVTDLSIDPSLSIEFNFCKLTIRITFATCFPN